MRALARALAVVLALAAPAGAEAPEAPVDDPRAVFEAATAAYEAGRPGEAEAGFARLVREGHATPTVLFNLGNAAYRQGKWPLAVLAYEWLLTLDPRDEEARDNLALARARLVVDEIPTDLSPGAREAMETLASIPGRATGGVFLGLWTVAWLLLARRVIAGPRAAWWPGVLLLMASLVFGLHAGWRLAAARGAPRGVLQSAEVEVRSGPGPTYETLFTLHAGTVVDRFDVRAGWSRVGVPHGPGGWIESRHVALIGHPETLP